MKTFISASLFQNLKSVITADISKEGIRPIEPCWEIFDCPENIRKECKVYLNWTKDTTFCHGWLYHDTQEGGPAKRGPCIHCKMAKKTYPEIIKMLKK